MNRFALFVMLLFSLSCKSQQQANLSTISEKLGSDAVVSYNESNTYALVQEKQALSARGDYTSKYLIVKLEDHSLLREGKVVRGYIKWIDDHQLELFETPGVIKEGQQESDFKNILDVRNLKPKTNKS